jgi:AraC-like DNA-binding protein
LNALPLIRASQLAPFSRAAEALGLPLKRYLRSSRLPSAWQERPEAFVPQRQLWRLLEEVARAEGISDFGIRAGVGGTIADIGRFGARLLHSVTLSDALRAMASEVNDHSSHARFGLTREGESVWFWRAGAKGMAAGRDQAEQYTLVLMIQIIQAGAGPSWCPERVRLQAATAPWAAELDVMGSARLGLGVPATAISIPAPLLTRGMPRATTPLPAVGREGESPGEDFPQSLRQALSAVLGQEPLHIELASEIAGISPRTLARRLEASGLSWRTLLDQIRYDAAVRLLKDPTRAVAEIAQHLDYADPANFTRAFRRWAGISPTAFRKLAEADVGAMA